MTVAVLALQDQARAALLAGDVTTAARLTEAAQALLRPSTIFEAVALARQHEPADGDGKPAKVVQLTKRARS